MSAKGVIFMAQLTMDKLVALAKNRGFVYPGSEIYGGLSNSWDYGPLGVQLKNNIKQAWWKKFVVENPYNVGLDSAIIMNPTTWQASGHIGGFSDPLMDCKSCKSRHRADDLIEEYNLKHGLDVNISGWSNEQMEQYIIEHKIPCPVCGNSNFTGVRKFNLMFKTFIGVTEDSTSTVYLRPETAQGIFVNFKNVQRTTRKKYLSASVKSARASATKSHPATSSSASVNLNKWNLNFSASPAPISNGLHIGRTSAINGCSTSA